MNKIAGIQTNTEELNELLRVLTNEGKLVGLDEEYESWDDIISLVHDTEDFLDNEKTREILARHFNVDSIVNYLINDDVILLIFDVEKI